MPFIMFRFRNIVLLITVFFLVRVQVAFSQQPACIYQQFLTTNERNSINNIIELDDSSFFFSGYCSGPTNIGVFLAKATRCGVVEWTKRYYSPNGLSLFVSGIERTKSNGYILTGITGNRCIGMRIDSAGNVLWHNFYDFYSNGSRGYNILRTGDTTFIIAGFSGYQGLLITIGESGVILNSKEVSDNVTYTVYTDIMQNAFGDIYIIGSSMPAGGYWNMSVSKIDTALNIQWSKRYDFGYKLNNWDIAPTADGGLLVGSVYELDTAFYPAISRLDSAGNILWSYFYTSPWFVGETLDLLESNDGRIFAAVEPEWIKPTVGSQFGLLSLDSLGIPLWCKIYNNDAWGFAFDVEETHDNCLIVGGEARINNQMGAFWIKADKNGNAGICPNDSSLSVIANAMSFILQSGSTSGGTASAYTLGYLPDTPEFSVISICDGIVGIEPEEEEYNLAGLSAATAVIIPNPGDGNFQLTGDFPENSTLTIYDAPGKAIGTFKIDCGNCLFPLYLPFSTGIYFYRLQHEGEVIKTGMIVIQR